MKYKRDSQVAHAQFDVRKDRHFLSSFHHNGRRCAVGLQKAVVFTSTGAHNAR